MDVALIRVTIHSGLPGIISALKFHFLGNLWVPGKQ